MYGKGLCSAQSEWLGSPLTPPLSLHVFYLCKLPHIYDRNCVVTRDLRVALRRIYYGDEEKEKLFVLYATGDSGANNHQKQICVRISDEYPNHPRAYACRSSSLCFVL